MFLPAKIRISEEKNKFSLTFLSFFPLRRGIREGPGRKTEAAIGLPFPVLFFNYSLSFTVQPEGMPLPLTSYFSTSCLWECLYLKGLREVVCKSEVNMDGKFAGMKKNA